MEHFWCSKNWTDVITKFDSNSFIIYILQTNIRDSNKYKVCSTVVCLHFYELHRNIVLKISAGKILTLEKIHWLYFFSFGQIQRKTLISFWKIFTNFIPTFGFTYERLRERIDFLDVVIKIKKDKITTNRFCKPTDGDQYLPYDFCHAKYIKR